MLGGTEGSQTFKGIIGHTRIYRRHLLFADQVKESAVHLNLLTLLFFYHFSFASCLNFLHNCLTYGRLTKNELKNTFFSLMGTCEPILKLSVASASQKAQRNNGRKKKPAQAREKRECPPRAHLFSLAFLIS